MKKSHSSPFLLADAQALCQRAWKKARRRTALYSVLITVPLLIAGLTVCWRLWGIPAVIWVGTVVFLLLAGWIRSQGSDLNHRWLIHRLNTLRPDFEDSADLILVEQPLNTLQQLQQQRVLQRFQQGELNLLPAWNIKRLVIFLMIAMAIFIPAWFWKSPLPITETNVDSPVTITPPPAMVLPIQIVNKTLAVTPPSYTQIPAFKQTEMNTKAPEGSTIQWNIQINQPVKHVEVVFHNKQRLALSSDNQMQWQAQTVLKESVLYRLMINGEIVADQPLYRIDAIPDQEPTIEVVQPQQSLTLVEFAQTDWEVEWVATDDYGINSAANLRVTLAQGSGENITFREQTLPLNGSGERQKKRFKTRLNFASLGFATGDDLIVQLTITDNRQPQPHSVRSASAILRWPSDLGNESTGVEGMIKTTLPAYFRSQRQIILDAEALIKQRRRLAGEEFLKQSDSIGVDQRILRLRYGQFLGEEAEGAPKAPPGLVAEGDHAAKPEEAKPEAGHDDHDHGKETSPTEGFGKEENVLQEYGHTHDHAEAATLLDPETRATLKAALDQMWQSELHLRQGAPEKALPYANKALEFIKKVQQASRIYLARVGPELPPIDFSRRLKADRKGISPVLSALVADTTHKAAPMQIWHTLQPFMQPTPIALSSLQQWIRENPSQVKDPLSLMAAMDAVQNDASCEPCQQQIKGQLWRVLPRPPVNVPRRSGANSQGQTYLDALSTQDVSSP